MRRCIPISILNLLQLSEIFEPSYVKTAILHQKLLFVQVVRNSEPEALLPRLQNPLRVPSLSQINTVHIHTFYFLYQHYFPTDSILPSGLLHVFSPKFNFLCSSQFSHTCYRPNPSHVLRFGHPNNIWREVHSRIWRTYNLPSIDT